VGKTSELRFVVAGAGEVSALFERPAQAGSLLVLAHGAGAGMTHAFLWSLSQQLGAAGMATFRYQFPYMENRRRLPDSPAVLTATVRAAVSRAGELAPDLPLLAGGKSLGGRMSSTAAAAEPLAKARGLVFFGFPLHPPNRPGVKRADHLAGVTVPMLFLQGTRDAFANLDLLRPICEQLGPLATLRVFEGADHSFHVPKSSGKTDTDMILELAQSVTQWAGRLL
jgi:uncharacterized protein